MVGLHRGLAGAAEPATATSCASRCRRSTTATPTTSTPASWCASTAPWSRRSSSCAATTSRIAAFLRSIEEPGALADTAGYSPDLSHEQKLRLLETRRRHARGCELAVEMQRERLAELQVRRKIRDDVESGAQKQQREYFLRKQMESIRKELGEDEGDLIAEYERKIAEAGDAGGGRRAGRAASCGGSSARASSRRSPR